MAKENAYGWTYCSLGGVVRVKIDKGEDIAHLGELDQKLWTVLSCPVDGLEFDHRTLEFLDTDHDGRVRVCEVVAAAQWLTSVLKDKDLILKGDSVLPLDMIDTSNEAGLSLYNSARQILANLGLEKDSISIEDTSDSVAIFAKTKVNGDGVITAATAEDDAALQQVIADCIATVGSALDRSGEAGVTAEQIEAFYAACADYAAWQAAAEADRTATFPYGEQTDAAFAACEAIKEKMEDYFMRCKLIGFDADAAGALDVSVDRIGAISSQNLATQGEEIATYPLSRPGKDLRLSFEGINPAWKTAFAAVKALVFDVDFPGQDGITEAEWNATLAKFDAFKAWKDAKKGGLVEPLGPGRIAAVLKEDRKADLLALVEADKALEAEANGIDEVDRLMHLYRDFYALLRNYVTFVDFYGRLQGTRGMFEVGQLYIDQRCCDLCVRVADMGQHGDMPKLSGMFLLYCQCTSKVLGKTMDIVAVMTNGRTRDLRPGKNGIFYDLEGHDWDATIMKVVENPISLKEAFWAPYRKFWDFCVGLVNKSAEDKDAKMTADLQATAATTTAAPADAAKKQPFDIAKFAGIFAAIGLALGYLGSFLTKLAAGIASTPLWEILLVIVVIMLLISGPSCFIAWGKLRRRNLGPVLNANGWAINSSVLVNIPFGNVLTSVAKYPKMNLDDPFKPKTPLWRKILRWCLCIIVVAGAALYFSGNLAKIGLPYPKPKAAPAIEVIEEAPAEAVADVEAAE